jgi:hypothetical protein
MSRSKPEDEVQVNPCKHWFSFDAGDGKGFKSYDKVAKKNNITALPFRFLVLDKLTTVTGFNEPENIGYYSNEIRNIKTDKLTVRSKNGIEAEGTWEQVKAKLGTKGASFCQSVYVMFFDGKTPTLGNIKMQGASLENWFAFCKENNIMEVAVQVKKANEKKKGKVFYYEPVFEVMAIKDETNQAAIELDVTLQEYLKGYLERNKTSTEEVKHEATPDVVAEVNTAKTVTKTADDDFISEINGVDEDDDMPF